MFVTFIIRIGWLGIVEESTLHEGFPECRVRFFHPQDPSIFFRITKNDTAWVQQQNILHVFTHGTHNTKWTNIQYKCKTV